MRLKLRVLPMPNVQLDDVFVVVLFFVTVSLLQNGFWNRSGFEIQSFAIFGKKLSRIGRNPPAFGDSLVAFSGDFFGLFSFRVPVIQRQRGSFCIVIVFIGNEGELSSSFVDRKAFVVTQPVSDFCFFKRF